jgi:GNAT superfamily N-acetyltransferase
MILNVSSYLNLLEILNMEMIERLDRRNQILHMDVYRKTWYFKFLALFPSFIRRIWKPIAKVGIRTYSKSSPYMSEVIDSVFQAEVRGRSETKRVGLFIYMFVQEKFRKLSLGYYLLAIAAKKCLLKSDDYMLIVHDDQGSGRLIKYYTQCGFVPIFDFIDKGMICKL